MSTPEEHPQPVDLPCSGPGRPRPPGTRRTAAAAKAAAARPARRTTRGTSAGSTRRSPRSSPRRASTRSSSRTSRTARSRRTWTAAWTSPRSRRSPRTPSPRRTSPREAGTVAGIHVAEAVLSIVCTDAFEVERHVLDGDRVEAGQKLLSVTTRTRDLLTGERSALNIMCRLSGIATATRAWADALEGTGRRSATPARPPPACAPWRSTPSAAAAASTTACRSPTRRWSRTTTWSRRAASPRRSRPCGSSSPTCRSRSRWTRSTRSARCWRRART